VRVLSLFSGIEAATLAWKPLGWTCVGVAEIEKFPCAVLQHYYPDVPNLGDVSKITEEQIAALGHIDLIIGGFPCQDISIAGKRKGFEHDGERTRSGLFHEAMRIVDIAKRRNGCRFLILENVPGLFSSRKGEDFRTVVNEILGTDFPLPKNKWQKAGVAFGPKGLIEWGTLDAQYFGLAQRRKRVFALADFGDWASRPPVLLESQSVCGDTPPSREARKDVAADAGAGVESGGRGGGFRYQNEQAGIVEDDVTATLRSESATTDERSVPAYVVQSPSTGNVAHCLNAGAMGRIDYESETLIAQTLRGEGFDASEDGTGRQNLVPVAFSAKDHGADATENLSPTLRAGGADKTHANSGNWMAVTYPINTQVAMRHEALGEATGMGIGEPDDPAYTLQAAHHHAVAFAQNQLGEVRTGDVANTINTNSNASGRNTPLCAIGWSEELTASEELAGTIQYGGQGGRHDGVMTPTMAVRRLTPRECERLQGFPDDFTLLPIKKPADGPRYKALGNSFAVPVITWIGRKLEEALRV